MRRLGGRERTTLRSQLERMQKTSRRIDVSSDMPSPSSSIEVSISAGSKRVASCSFF